MTAIQKLIRKIETHPVRNDITFDELFRYLRYHGYSCDRSRGSHAIFEKNGDVLVIPVHYKHVKPVYIRESVSHVKEEQK